MSDQLDQHCINTMRFLPVDAVQSANSGHPGMPPGAAAMAYVLWTRLLQHNPRNPDWFDRDRFVLSAGHGSMLLYSLLHLSGYELSLDDIKQFPRGGSAGASRARTYAGCGDHHRAARAGLRQCGRHGHRRSATGGKAGQHAVKPKPLSSSTSTGSTTPEGATHIWVA